MPYIPAENRPQYDSLIQPLAQKLRDNGVQVGEINYVVTQLLLSLWSTSPSYGTGSKLRAALTDAHDEFYRTALAPYEDEKSRQNGPVVPLVLT